LRPGKRERNRDEQTQDRAPNAHGDGQQHLGKVAFPSREIWWKKAPGRTGTRAVDEFDAAANAVHQARRTDLRLWIGRGKDHQDHHERSGRPGPSTTHRCRWSQQGIVEERIWFGWGSVKRRHGSLLSQLLFDPIRLAHRVVCRIVDGHETLGRQCLEDFGIAQIQESQLQQSAALA
jgi:hypothetical protein